MESHTVQIQKLLLKSVLLGSCLFGLAACSSVNKSVFLDEDVYETEDETEDVAQTNEADYLCNNLPLNIFFHAEQAQLSWKEKNYVLTHAISASGAFYLGEGLSFWIHGDEAELEFNGVEKNHCRLVRIES
ncbi:MliC family protein [Marinomonas sp.]|uniref:MliC family protein n=1 Tax=Marinomonas sp. TaxID=1904862 RepID=UPI003BAAC866